LSASTTNTSTSGRVRLICHQSAFQSVNVLGRILVFHRRAAVLAIFPASKIVNRENTRRRPCYFQFNAKGIVTCQDTEVAHFSPILTPRVAYNPVCITGGLVKAPTNDTHNMIHHHVPHFRVTDNTSFVIDQGFRVHACTVTDRSMNNKIVATSLRPHVARELTYAIGPLA